MRLSVHFSCLRRVFRVVPFLAVLAGCGVSTDDTAIGLADERNPMVRLEINAGEIVSGGSVTLTWSSYQVSACVASGDWSGNRGWSGRETIEGVTADSSFVLTCSGPSGLLMDSVQVRVVEQVVAPTLDFSSSATQVRQGESVALSWYAQNADRCTASGDWQGVKATEGLETSAGLQNDSVFALECSGPGGWVRQSITVLVPPPQPVLPSLSLSVSQPGVAYGGSVTLSWSSSNADSCTASGGWGGRKSLSGSERISGLTTDARFTLECTGTGGTTRQVVMVSVTAQQSSGSALLSWFAPTENTDNTPLEDLAGFRIYYGTATGNYSETIDVPTAGVTEYMVENLAPATWYFVVTAYNSLGIESAPSKEVSKTIN